MNPIYVYWFILHISNVCISSFVQLNCRYIFDIPIHNVHVRAHVFHHIQQCVDMR